MKQSNIALSFLVHGQQHHALAPLGSLPASIPFKQAAIVTILANLNPKKIGNKE